MEQGAASLAGMSKSSLSNMWLRFNEIILSLCGLTGTCVRFLKGGIDIVSFYTFFAQGPNLPLLYFLINFAFTEAIFKTGLFLLIRPMFISRLNLESIWKVYERSLHHSGENPFLSISQTQTYTRQIRIGEEDEFWVTRLSTTHHWSGELQFIRSFGRLTTARLAIYEPPHCQRDQRNRTSTPLKRRASCLNHREK
jgi:hypothetical protein